MLNPHQLHVANSGNIGTELPQALEILHGSKSNDIPGRIDGKPLNKRIN